MEKIQIYSPTGELLIDTLVNTGSKRKMELMKEDYISVKVSLDKPLYIPIGSYCAGEDLWRFVTTDLQNLPTYNKTTGGYDYTLQLDAYYYAWKHKLFKFSPSYGGSEASWSLTDTLPNHMKLFLANLKALGFTYGDSAVDYVFEYDDTIEDIAEAKLLTYSSVYLVDALTQIANEWDCEWWITDNVIHMGHCENFSGDTIDLEIGTNCENIVPSGSKSTYGTRLYAFGSTRNISNRYRKDLIFTIDTISNNRKQFGDSTRPMDLDYLNDNAVVGGKTSAHEITFAAKDYQFSYSEENQGALLYVTSDYLSLRAGNWDISSDMTIKFKLTDPSYSGGAFPISSVMFELWYKSEDDDFQYKMGTYSQVGYMSYNNVFSLPVSAFDFTQITATKEYSSFRLEFKITVTYNTTLVRTALMLGLEFDGAIKLEGGKIYGTAEVPITFTCSDETDALHGQTLTCVYNLSANAAGSNTFILPSGSFTSGRTYKFTIDENYLIITKVPSSYFTSRYANNVVTYGITENRLMLPEDTPYIDSEENLTDAEVVEIIKVFEDVYPRTDCFVKGVTTHEFQDEEEDEYGNTVKVKWLAYRLTTDDITFDEDWILDNGEKLQIQFQTGSLAGMIFECNFYDVGKLYEDGAYNTEQIFEVVRNDSYGRDLPDTILKPKAGDEFILVNWDVTAFTETGLIEKAEQELKEEAIKYMEKAKIDPNTYTASLFSDYAYGMDEEGNLNNNYEKVFPIGQRVKIINAAYFKTGSRESRVMGFEKCLDLPYDTPQYIVGESTAYSRIGAIEDNIETLTLKGNETTVGNGSGSSVYVIGRNDSTPASDTNVFSAARSLKEFLSALDDDTANGLITFAKGLISKGLIKAQGGITLDDNMVSSLFDELAETGLGLTKDTSGNWSLFLKNITVWGKAIFRELEIRRLSYVGGDFIFSPAGCTIDKVVPIDAAGEEMETFISPRCVAARCYYVADDGTTATTNSFQAYDQALCETFNIHKAGNYSEAANRYYWRLVTAVGDGYVDLSLLDYDGCDDSTKTNELPQKGDVLVCVGNRYDAARQNVIKISTEGSEAPAIQMFHGVDSYHLGAWTDSEGVTHTNRTAIISPALVEINADIFKLISGGQTQTIKEYVDGQVPVVVSLTSDSHLFEGDTEKALAGSYSFGVQATRGTESVNCNVVSVSGAPSGMTVSVGSVVLDSEGVQVLDSEGVALRDGDGEITITLDGTTTETAGTLDVEIECEGVTYHKYFSWGVALVGATGDKGADGEDAIYIRVISNATALQGVEVNSKQYTTINEEPYLAVTADTAVMELALYKGENIISGSSLLVSWKFSSDDISGIQGSTASIKMNNGYVSLAVSKSYVKAVASEDKSIYLPTTNPSILAEATYGGVTYRAVLPVTIDYTYRWAGITQTNKEIRAEVGRLSTNINLIEDIPQPTITDEEFLNLFQDRVFKAGAFQPTEMPKQNITVPCWGVVNDGDVLEFNRPYASYVDDDCALKAGNVAYLQLRYYATGNFEFSAGINEDADYYQLVGDSTWRTLTMKIGTGGATGDKDEDDLACTFTAEADAISLYIAGMTLLREGSSIVSTMGYVDVKADEVEAAVTNGLTKTGIDITNGQILATTKNFKITNGSGKTTFSVDEDGNLIGAGSASFNGDIKCKSGYFGGMQRRQKTTVTSANQASFIKSDPFGNYYIDFNDITPWLVLDSSITIAAEASLSLPYFFAINTKATQLATFYGNYNDEDMTKAEMTEILDYVRSFVGNRVMIYNNSGVDLVFQGLMSLDKYLGQNGQYPSYNVNNKLSVPAGCFMSAECVCIDHKGYTVDSSGNVKSVYDYGEMVCWIATIGTTASTDGIAQ